jgi:erythromycin esterase-like protein
LAAAAALRIETEDLITELRVRRPELIARSSADCYSEAVHYASVARQLLSFYVVLARDPGYAGSLAVRDALMADNLVYIMSREQRRGKVLVFAHNAHLQRGQLKMPMGPQLCTWWPAGSHLHEMFGPRYAVIGSAVGVSEANGIGHPEAGSLEAQLTPLPGPAQFIPTHQGQGLPSTEIAALAARSRGTKNPGYVPLSPQSFTDFDAWAMLDSVTYTRGAPPLP